MVDREKTALGIREMLMRDTWRDIDANRPRYQHILNDALALLKEQEAIKPEKSGGMRPGWWCICGYELSKGDKYCHECGRKVKWE